MPCHAMPCHAIVALQDTVIGSFDLNGSIAALTSTVLDHLHLPTQFPPTSGELVIADRVGTY